MVSMIEVHLYGKFRRLSAAISATEDAMVNVEWEDGDTIESILCRLNIESHEVGHLFLNAEYSGLRRYVAPGDRLGVFPREMGLLYRQYFPKIE